MDKECIKNFAKFFVWIAKTYKIPIGNMTQWIYAECGPEVTQEVLIEINRILSQP